MIEKLKLVKKKETNPQTIELAQGETAEIFGIVLVNTYNQKLKLTTHPKNKLIIISGG
jgi:hypothetical protein